MSSDINVQTFSGKVNITSNLLVGSSHLFVDTINNRVGLVTTTPDAGIHVNSNAYVHTDFRVGSGIVMNDTSGRITAGSFVGDGSAMTGINSDSGSWVNGANSNVHLATSTDKVGIGTSSPEAKLHLYQSAGSTNLVEKHTNASTGDYQQHINYTHYASVAGGASRDPDNSRGLWIGNMVDENDVSPSGANFAAFTDSFQFYAVADRTKYDSSLSFTSNTDNLLYSGGTFNKVMRISADGNVTATTFTGALSTSVTPGSYLTGSAYNGSTARTFAVDATTTNTASKIVARDSNGNINAHYVNGAYMNMSHSRTNRNSDTIFYSSTDNYIRKNTPAGMISSLGLANSATIEATTADTANKIAQRNASGDIFARLFRSDYQNQSTCTGAIAFRTSTSDNYIRFCSDMGAVRSRIGCYGSGSNITRTSHSNGFLVGSYNSVGSNDTKTNPIYTIGSNYMPSDTSLNDMYGIGYSHGNFTSILTGGWGMYVAADGDARIGLNGSSGHIKCTGHIYCGNTVFVGGSTSRGIRGVSGNYGTVQTTGEGAGGHEGYSINGRWVFMSGDANTCGIFNDTDDDWSIICYRNGKVRLDYNGVQKFYTESGGATVVGELNADAISARGTGSFGYNWDGVFMRPDGQVYISVDDNFYFRDNSSTSSNLRRHLFDTNNGRIYAEGTVYSNHGLDYAEYFEWFDGNPDNEDRIGCSVSLVENTNKIKKCEPGEIPLGVVSGTSSMTGGGAGIHWNGYWKNDEWGRATYKQLEDDNGELVFNEDGTPKMKRAINPEYDENLDSEYLTRDQRKEWACVGLLGQVFVKKGGVTSKNWIKMKEVDSVKDLWFINAVFMDNEKIETIQSDLQAEKVKTRELEQKLEILEMSHASLIQRIEALEKL